MNKLINRDYIQETIRLKHSIEGAFIDLGARLKKIRDEKLYEGQYENFKEFLTEMDMGEGTASRIISVFSFYIEKHGVSRDKLARAGWSNLYSYMKLTDGSTTKDQVQDIVEKAVLLRREDIVDELRDHKHPNCKHKNFHDLHLRVCEDCGLRTKI